MLTINQIDKSWQQFLKQEFKKDYFIELKNFLKEEYKQQTIYPPKEQIFNALNLTPFDEVKVVILGQDPYHGENQSHGLAFSVSVDVKIPPSLRNIYKEIKSELNIPIPDKGNLESWAKQGVLLLNTALTVQAGKAASHRKKGWEQFTDTIIEKLSENKSNLVFLLWGNFAHAKEKLIDTNKHTILKTVHPSPLSAHNGFWGCNHFIETNKKLKSLGIEEINWKIENINPSLF